MSRTETARPLPAITEESLVSSVLSLFPRCRGVFQRYGGLRCCDGALGPDEPVSWFARRRGVPVDQLVSELNEAIRPGPRAGASHDRLPTPDREVRFDTRAMEIFLRYGFMPEIHRPVANAREFEAASGAAAQTGGESACTPRVWEALENCCDPRFPEDNIVALGFVDFVRCDPRNATAHITLTLSVADPCICNSIVEQVRDNVRRVPDVQEVQVTIARICPWRPERMKPEVRRRLGLEW